MTHDVAGSGDDAGRAGLWALARSHAMATSQLANAIAAMGAMAQLRLESRSLRCPPDDCRDGQCYAVPRAATGDWGGHAGEVALRFGSGWIWLTPREGWRCWIADEGCVAQHDGTGWRGGALALAANGAGTFLRVTPLEVTVGRDAVQQVGMLPAPALLLAVTARVVRPMSGALTGWRIGVPGADALFGSGFGLLPGDGPRRVVPRSLSLRRARPLVLTAETGAFDGGQLRIAIHWLEVSGPSA